MDWLTKLAMKELSENWTEDQKWGDYGGNG